MVDIATAPWGILVLRLALGALFLAHGLRKLLVSKPAGVEGYFRSLGLPGWVGLLTMAAEILGGAALLLGVWPRYVALALTPMMVGTIVLVHGKNGFVFDNKGGGWEYSALWSVALVAVFLLGDGPFALCPSPNWF